MPERFIHSRSFVMPSSVTLPFVQCHHVRGLADSGGVMNPCASGSRVGPAGALWATPTTATASTATPARIDKPAMSLRIIQVSSLFRDLVSLTKLEGCQEVQS